MVAGRLCDCARPTAAGRASHGDTTPHRSLQGARSAAAPAPAHSSLASPPKWPPASRGRLRLGAPPSSYSM
eukprot:2024502-Prymnesium_polylepis.1